MNEKKYKEIQDFAQMNVDSPAQDFSQSLEAVLDTFEGPEATDFDSR